MRYLYIALKHENIVVKTEGRICFMSAVETTRVCFNAVDAIDCSSFCETNGGLDEYLRRESAWADCEATLILIAATSSSRVVRAFPVIIYSCGHRFFRTSPILYCHV